MHCRMFVVFMGVLRKNMILAWTVLLLLMVPAGALTATVCGFFTVEKGNMMIQLSFQRVKVPIEIKIVQVLKF